MYKPIFAGLLLVALSNGALIRRTACPGSGHTAINPACCVWYDVAEDLQQNLFHSQCEAEVHEALRATFHDAIGFSPALTAQGKFGGGGADGSLIRFGLQTEFAFPANNGLEDIALELKVFADRHNVSYGDIIQFAGALGVSNCQAAPKITTFVGRPPAKAASPPNLIPQPQDSVSSILARFGDAGISVANTIWLLASHSTAAQNHVDPTIPGAPFDSSPAVFDTQFYLETLLNGTSFPGTPNNVGEAKSPIKGEFRLQSDFSLARDPSTCALWILPINQKGFIQGVFAAAMTQLSLLGQNQSQLIDCTEAIPASAGTIEEATYPPGMSAANLDSTCSTATVKALDTQPGSPHPIPPVPPASGIIISI